MQNVERIWYIVNLIPKGKVMPYGHVADLAGLPGRARFVSYALRQATAEQLLPWHRVINSQGKLSFARHSDAFIKQTELLRLDGVMVESGKISLNQYQWRPRLDELLMLPF